MTGFEKYWASLVVKNHGLTDDEATLRLTVKSLKAQVERAYDAGYGDRQKLQEALRKIQGKFGGNSSILDGLFG